MEQRRGVLIAIVMCLWLSRAIKAQLQIGFYKSTCPQAEWIVREEVIKGVLNDSGFAAGLVRMHFHDCFVRGCEASVLLDSTPGNIAEKDSPINNPSLRGFQVIDNAKSRLEEECEGVVSCADILAFAARDSVLLSSFGAVWYEVPAGRRDGVVSLAAETFTNLPGPTFNLSQLTQSFAVKGISQSDMVTLSGAHTIGRSHCTSFSNRLYNYSSTVSQDPSLDPIYAELLKRECPNGSNDTNLVVPMDPQTPFLLDVSYYNNVNRRRGLFTSDQALLSSNATAAQVWAIIGNQRQWRIDFASAMVKMGQIEVFTGSSGEIRLNCSVVNP